MILCAECRDPVREALATMEVLAMRVNESLEQLPSRFDEAVAGVTKGSVETCPWQFHERQRASFAQTQPLCARRFRRVI